jgi:hypothetical protein
MSAPSNSQTNHLGGRQNLNRGRFKPNTLSARSKPLVVFGIALRGQIATRSHRNRASGDFGQSRRNDDPRGVNRARQARRKSKRYGQAIRHSNDDVADGFRAGEMAFRVGCLGHDCLRNASVNEEKAIPKPSLPLLTSKILPVEGLVTLHWDHISQKRGCGRPPFQSPDFRGRNRHSLSRPLKVDVSALHIRADELHAKPVANVHALKAAHQSSFNGRMQQTDPRALVRCAGDNGIEPFPDS